MRKLIVSVHASLDGIISGPKGDEENFVSWGMPGVEDSQDDVLKFFDTVDTILLGRVTYEGLSQAWPNMSGEWADKMNLTPKLVACEKGELDEVAWGSFDTVEKLEGDVEAKVKKLKQQPGKDIITFGSAKLVQSLANAGLVDEYRMVVHPVIVGSGKRLFAHIEERHDLRLASVKKYDKSGAMLVQYIQKT